MKEIFKDLTDLQETDSNVFINSTHMLKVYHKDDLESMEVLEGTIKSLTGKTPELRLDFCKKNHIGVVYKGNFK